MLNVNEYIISFFIAALGTSLPELVVDIRAIYIAAVAHGDMHLLPEERHLRVGRHFCHAGWQLARTQLFAPVLDEKSQAVQA